MADDTTHYKYTNAVLLVPFTLVLGIWLVYYMELRLGVNLNNWGIYPRTPIGLRGIVFSPWIHGSLEHLYNNSIPLAVLTAALFYFYRSIAWKTLFLGVLFSGLITWGIGRTSYHIGASGLIYVLASFIFFKGIFTKYYRLVALSLGVVFVYGGMLWYIFPVLDGMSWEGHLGGFLTGLILALFLNTPVPKPTKYPWESEDYQEDADPFMRHFDADGNFIEHPPEEEQGSTDALQIRYHYRDGKDAKTD
ncbi:rhomboid family intramembrane serine protease [Robiginitalea aurantiaca]|uniref:Rhomboid family intramembrane serine protease n=1 Tax=Robiginitalea aurantiaca TaxID=3056915 RepID=A0ABT7WDV0_9FLAO|nr:rhomboid family intramembrane serine protease [Robiginitalea aurantiaca]MDM9631093.1 rhomboid family intramembrane serine protease [Robiginitalea aurantiaca]